MDSYLLPTDIALVVVKHPASGDSGNGKVICNEVVKKLASHHGPVCIFHDASDMLSADAGYAEEFKNLSVVLAERVRECVCVIPLLAPRIMALAVAKASGRKWTIFKSTAEAVNHLHSLGADIGHLRMYSGSVAVKRMEKAA
jgi:hypothetical protein